MPAAIIIIIHKFAAENCFSTTVDGDWRLICSRFVGVTFRDRFLWPFLDLFIIAFACKVLKLNFINGNNSHYCNSFCSCRDVFFGWCTNVHEHSFNSPVEARKLNGIECPQTTTVIISLEFEFHNVNTKDSSDELTTYPNYIDWPMTNNLSIFQWKFFCYPIWWQFNHYNKPNDNKKKLICSLKYMFNILDSIQFMIIWLLVFFCFYRRYHELILRPKAHQQSMHLTVWWTTPREDKT